MNVLTVIKKARAYCKSFGVSMLMFSILDRGRRNHRSRIQPQQNVDSLLDLAKQRQLSIGAKIRFSILIPVFNTKPRFLSELGDSLLMQSYPIWEACFYDGNSSNPETLRMLDQLGKQDARFRVFYGEKNLGIAENTNRAFEKSTGDYIALCDHDDLYAPDALYRMWEAIESTDADMLYSDEDKIDENNTRHFYVHQKPAFSPDTLRCSNYICHMLVIKRSLFTEIGCMRSQFEGSQDYDLILRASEKAQNVVHVPYVLYHWRVVSTSMSHQKLETCMESAVSAVREHLLRIKLKGEVERTDMRIRVRYTIESFGRCACICYRQPTVKQMCRLSAMLPTEFTLYAPAGALDVSALDEKLTLESCAQRVNEDWIILADPKVRILTPDWLKELMMFAQQQGVGCVSATVYHRSGLLYFTPTNDADDKLYCLWFQRYQAAALHGIYCSYNPSALHDGLLLLSREKLLTLAVREPSAQLSAATLSRLCQAEGWRLVCTPFAVASL